MLQNAIHGYAAIKLTEFLKIGSREHNAAGTFLVTRFYIVSTSPNVSGKHIQRKKATIND